MSNSDGGNSKRTMVPIILREIEQRPDLLSHARIGIVYSVENWDLVEPLVNELRYELHEKYQVNIFNIKLTQTESIHEIPLFISRFHQRSELIFAIGVELMSSPTYEPRLVDLLTRRIDALASCDSTRRLPVFDCILVRESREQLDNQIQAISFAESWARRSIDAFTALPRIGH
ncbi:hypothetical protein GGI21_000424 [Coemansia aciculifera]|nr:hypothetical protein GGI21_000424 [Coemansia aciculifera]